MGFRLNLKGLVLLLLLPGLVAEKALADDAETYQAPKWRLGLLAGQWWETSLPDAPAQAIRGDFDLRNAYYLSANVNRNITGAFRIPFWGLENGIPFGGVEIDTQAINHFGVDNGTWEFAGALCLRTGDLRLGALRANLMIGDGLSYVFGELALEKGEEGVRGENQKQLQNNLLIETEFFLAGFPQSAFILRLHHRSGVYGLISDSNTGSNWLSAGLRWRF
jgi:hypothetical protein